MRERERQAGFGDGPEKDHRPGTRRSTASEERGRALQLSARFERRWEDVQAAFVARASRSRRLT